MIMKSLEKWRAFYFSRYYGIYKKFQSETPLKRKELFQLQDASLQERVLAQVMHVSSGS